MRLTRNFGSQMAIVAGLAEAKGDAAAVLSADLQEPPELLPEMVAAWRRGATAVLAVRRSRPEGLATRAAAGFYYRTLRRLAFSADAGGRVRLLPDRPAGDRLPGREPRGPHVAAGAASLGRVPDGPRRPTTASRARKARRAGRFAKKLKYFLDAVISFSYAPLRWMSVAGAGLAVLAFAYAVFLVVYKLVHGQPIAGWTSLMVALAFFSGVQLLSLGVLGEYLWRTLDAARARKGYPRAGADGKPTRAGSRPGRRADPLDLGVRQLGKDREGEHFARRSLRLQGSRPRGRRARRKHAWRCSGTG